MELRLGSFDPIGERSGDKLTIYAGDIRFVPSDNEGRNFSQTSVLSSCAALGRVSLRRLEFGSTKEEFVARSGQVESGSGTKN